MRVWVAPYESSDRTLFDQQFFIWLLILGNGVLSIIRDVYKMLMPLSVLQS
nr:hypothetical protein [Acinetobacter baumannii]